MTVAVPHTVDTADLVAQRYGVSRERQDEYALTSQARTHAAQQAGKFDDEIVPMTVTMATTDKASGEVTKHEYTVTKDECNRPSTTLESLQKLDPVRLETDPQATITAGNASQLSDGASACVLMSEDAAAAAGCTPLGVFKGFAVGGCSPEEMGIGPTVAVPRLLSRHGLKVDDIDLWELNESFAVVPLQCADVLVRSHREELHSLGALKHANTQRLDLSVVTMRADAGDRS